MRNIGKRLITYNLKLDTKRRILIENHTNKDLLGEVNSSIPISESF